MKETWNGFYAAQEGFDFFFCSCCQQPREIKKGVVTDADVTFLNGLQGKPQDVNETPVVGWAVAAGLVAIDGEHRMMLTKKGESFLAGNGQTPRHYFYSGDKDARRILAFSTKSLTTVERIR